MTLSQSDIDNLEHNIDAKAKNAVAYGKTTGGAYVEVQVDADGKVVTSGGGGSSTFTGLSDTPNSYSGHSLKGVRVNNVENALEFYTITGGTDEKVAIDSGATADYIGAASNDGVLRTNSPLTYSDGGNFITLGVDETAIDHDNLNNFVLNEHIDHSGVNINAGTGLSGGGNITASRTLNLNASVDDLTDVSSSTESNRDALLFNSGTSEYENRAIVEADISDLNHDDTDAIHDNVAGEINAITEKVSPVDADLLLIEDSQDSNNKKKVQITNLPTGGGAEELSDLSDVNISTPSSGQIMTYHSVNTRFQNLSLGASNGLQKIQNDSALTISGINASTIAKGVASFNSTNFSASSGAISLSSLAGFQLSDLDAYRVPAGENLEFRDAQIYITSPADGDMELVADGEIEISPGTQFLSDDGMTIGLPSNGNYKVGFRVDASAQGYPGIRFLRTSAGATGGITFGTTTTNFFEFGVLGNNPGEGHMGIHTSNTLGKEALNIDQTDADQAFINFEGTADSSFDFNISTTELSGFQNMVLIEVNGTKQWIKTYDVGGG